MLLAGWSFGADMTLATVDDRVAGWLAIAPPLRMAPDFSRRRARPAAEAARAWPSTTSSASPASVVEATDGVGRDRGRVIVGGASHFFVGRTDRVVTLARRT